ncbi:hypothetical protein LR004_02980 [Candidatus Gracilibacteria bacterium]|nr:hypothetical protein [Candidatus Gracilibacteria bacterium]
MITNQFKDLVGSISKNKDSIFEELKKGLEEIDSLKCLTNRMKFQTEQALKNK